MPWLTFESPLFSKRHEKQVNSALASLYSDARREIHERPSDEALILAKYRNAADKFLSNRVLSQHKRNLAGMMWLATTGLVLCIGGFIISWFYVPIFGILLLGTAIRNAISYKLAIMGLEHPSTKSTETDNDGQEDGNPDHEVG